MKHIINYTNVTLLRKEHLVLKNVSLSIDSGEFVYLTGRVGSGKSTLLKSFYADVPVAEGVASVLDFDMSAIKSAQIPYLRRKIGFVFQDFQLLTDRSVYANLEFVLKATGWKNRVDIDDRINEVLDSVEMKNKSYKMPYELSGGEQQRIVIARALLNHPELILADEPTGNLDPETGQNVMSRLHEIAAKGTAVVMATHNLALIEEFPGRRFYIDDAKCIELEPTDSVMQPSL